ncbi:hypothetical protein PHMEG_00023565 [Phytophthora megakarya]|uniref:RxLR effector protein n=1 Tax=Phytophthora megakarya TaxID=4795 RepID=A0A225VFU4_9STRA|nr:hypothetical protein PHMEG_00023565 [Phytophthora megakarya]
MRACYSLVVILAAFLVGSNALSTASPSENQITKKTPVQGSDKRYLRSSGMNDLNNANDERMFKIDPTKIDEILDIKRVDWALHPDRIDEVFAGLKDNKIFGKIDKKTIDSVRGSNRNHYQKIFGQWKEADVFPTALTQFTESNPALKHKYLWVAKMYDGFMKQIK